MKKGKILKIRLGYNANSSSISSAVKVLVWGSSIVIITINMISALIYSKAFKKQTTGVSKHEEEKSM